MQLYSPHPANTDDNNKVRGKWNLTERSITAISIVLKHSGIYEITYCVYREAIITFDVHLASRRKDGLVYEAECLALCPLTGRKSVV